VAVLVIGITGRTRRIGDRGQVPDAIGAGVIGVGDNLAVAVGNRLRPFERIVNIRRRIAARVCRLLHMAAREIGRTRCAGIGARDRRDLIKPVPCVFGEQGARVRDLYHMVVGIIGVGSDLGGWVLESRHAVERIVCVGAHIIIGVGRGEQVALRIIDIFRNLGRQRARHLLHAVAIVVEVGSRAFQYGGRIIGFDREQVAGGVIGILLVIGQRIGNFRKAMRRVIGVGAERGIRERDLRQHAGRVPFIGRLERALGAREQPAHSVVGECGHQRIWIGHAQQPPVGVIRCEAPCMAERILEGRDAALRIIGISSDVAVRVLRREHLAGGAVGIIPRARERAGGHRLVGGVALGIIGEGRGAVGLHDLRRQMERGEPCVGDGARDGAARSIHFRGRLAAGVVHKSRDMAVEIGELVDEAIGVIAKRAAARRREGRARHGHRPHHIEYRRNRVGVRIAVGIRHRCAGVGGVGDLGEVCAARMLAGDGAAVGIIGPCRIGGAILIRQAGERVDVAGIGILIFTRCGIRMRNLDEVVIGIIGVGVDTAARDRHRMHMGARVSKSEFLPERPGDGR